MLVKQLPTGTIDLVTEEGLLKIQFNGPCQEMLPYCNAICCRLRPIVNTLLTPEEADRFDSEPHAVEAGQHVLSHREGHCAYLHAGNRCLVHSSKPKACQQWHCSPSGVDEQGKPFPDTNKGWVLTPAILWYLGVADAPT